MNIIITKHQGDYLRTLLNLIGKDAPRSIQVGLRKFRQFSNHNSKKCFSKPLRLSMIKKTKLCLTQKQIDYLFMLIGSNPYRENHPNNSLYQSFNLYGQYNFSFLIDHHVQFKGA